MMFFFYFALYHPYAFILNKGKNISRKRSLTQHCSSADITDCSSLSLCHGDSLVV